MTSESLRILVIGAHPDDPEFGAGGVVALYTQRGHRVRMVSLTNGDTGHHEMGGAPLARRRRSEAAAAGTCLRAEYVVLDNHNGALLPTLDVRKQVIRLIREFKPDLVMTHRPCDYHPDHRYTAQVVHDALTQIIIPNVVSDVPPLRARPVVVYLWDRFQKPYPFIPDVVVGTDEVVERKVDALHCHVSQMYEFEPYVTGCQAPEMPSERRAWLRDRLEPRLRHAADLYRERLIELYGEERGAQIRYAEAFEGCEYGAPLTDANLRTIFPFFGSAAG